MSQYIAEVTAVSTKGQVVIPKSVRDTLDLKTGSKLMIFTDGENILLKPITQPSLDEFSSLLDAAKEWASDVGLTEADINDAIKNVRANKSTNI